MALTISVGFVVDDAIVMIENIVRYIEEGERPFEAALKGAGQIGFTIISITFSLIAVFIPLLFMGGIIGRLFREFAVDRLGRGRALGLHLADPDAGDVLAVPEARRATHKRGRLNRWPRTSSTPSLRGYDRGLQLRASATSSRRCCRRSLLIVVTGYLYVTIPKGFFPQQDTGFIFGQAEARQDISFAAMADARSTSSPTSSSRIRRSPASSASPAPTGGNPTENTARMFIQLKPHDERDATRRTRSSSGCGPRWPRCRAPSSSCRPARTSASAAGSADRSTSTR